MSEWTNRGDSLKELSHFLRQARPLVRTLHKPNPYIYWADFLSSIITGHLLFIALLYSDLWLGGSYLSNWAIKAILYVTIVILYYRSLLFAHELFHLPKKGFRSFRVVWNILCGIPFMVPSTFYQPHITHHRKNDYGTSADSEYLNLSHQPPSAIIVFVLSTFIAPIAGLFRFAILAPIGWLIPATRIWIYRHASTMLMNIKYVRSGDKPETRRLMLVQEIACFCVCVFHVVCPLRGYFPIFVHLYVVGIGLLFVNNLRTLGAHNYMSQGTELSFGAQLLDSCVYPFRPWITELWGPIGLRYHATHHLFPTIPYHNLGIAHRALMAGLPADSPYHKTVKVSLISEILGLWRRSSQSRTRVRDSIGSV